MKNDYLQIKLLKREALNSGAFEVCGAAEYIKYLTEKRRKAQKELSEWEIHDYYRARLTILESPYYKTGLSEEKRQRFERRLEMARKAYNKSDPERGLPF